MHICFFAILFFCAAAHAGLNSLQVWARVASTVVTDRAIYIECLLENPKLWKGSVADIPIEVQNQSFQRLLVQAMTLEEHRIFRSENVGSEEINQEIRRLESSLGAQYKNLLKFFDLSETILRDKILARILLEKSLKSRVKNYAQNMSEKDQQRVIEDWISQLRGRYRVQNYRLDRNNPRLKLVSEDAPL